VVAPDVRVELRRVDTGEAFVSRAHRLDFESIPVLLEALCVRMTPFDAAPLDQDAGLRPIMTMTVFATDDGVQALMGLATTITAGRAME